MGSPTQCPFGVDPPVDKLKFDAHYQPHKFPRKPWLDSPALALWDARPGQSQCEANSLARLGPAYFGLAWPGFWPQAEPCTPLMISNKQINECQSIINNQWNMIIS